MVLKLTNIWYKNHYAEAQGISRWSLLIKSLCLNADSRLSLVQSEETSPRRHGNTYRGNESKKIEFLIELWGQNRLQSELLPGKSSRVWDQQQKRRTYEEPPLRKEAYVQTKQQFIALVRWNCRPVTDVYLLSYVLNCIPAYAVLCLNQRCRDEDTCMITSNLIGCWCGSL